MFWKLVKPDLKKPILIPLNFGRDIFVDAPLSDTESLMVFVRWPAKPVWYTVVGVKPGIYKVGCVEFKVAPIGELSPKEDAYWESAKRLRGVTWDKKAYFRGVPVGIAMLFGGDRFLISQPPGSAPLKTVVIDRELFVLHLDRLVPYNDPSSLGWAFLAKGGKISKWAPSAYISPKSLSMPFVERVARVQNGLLIAKIPVKVKLGEGEYGLFVGSIPTQVLEKIYDARLSSSPLVVPVKFTLPFELEAFAEVGNERIRIKDINFDGPRSKFVYLPFNLHMMHPWRKFREGYRLCQGGIEVRVDLRELNACLTKKVILLAMIGGIATGIVTSIWFRRISFVGGMVLGALLAILLGVAIGTLNTRFMVAFLRCEGLKVKVLTKAKRFL